MTSPATPIKVLICEDQALVRAGYATIFGAQPDTPAKLAGFAYAFEHLEIGAYELLRRVAQRAGDVRNQQRLWQENAESDRATSHRT